MKYNKITYQSLISLYCNKHPKQHQETYRYPNKLHQLMIQKHPLGLLALQRLQLLRIHPLRLNSTIYEKIYYLNHKYEYNIILIEFYPNL